MKPETRIAKLALELEDLLEWIKTARKPDPKVMAEKCALYRAKKQEKQQLELQMQMKKA